MLNSFFIAGFPGTTRVPRNGRRIEQTELCGHQRFYAQDYARAKKLGLLVARESAQWSAIERIAGQYDFSFVRRRIHSARAQGVQLIWTLLDGGWPADVDIMRPMFVQRFATYARAFARLLRDQEVKNPIVVPIRDAEIATLRLAQSALPSEASSPSCRYHFSVKPLSGKTV